MIYFSKLLVNEDITQVNTLFIFLFVFYSYELEFLQALLGIILKRVF